MEEKTVKRMKNNTQKLTITAMVLAIRLILDILPSFNIANLTQMGFGFIGAALAGVLLGPRRAALVGLLVDILGHFLGGGSASSFFPGYTLTAIVGGLIYGYCLYRKPLHWKRILVAVVIITLVCNLGLNSLWVHLMTQKAFGVFMGVRIIKNLISLPLNTLVLTLLFTNKTMQAFIDQYQL